MVKAVGHRRHPWLFSVLIGLAPALLALIWRVAEFVVALRRDVLDCGFGRSVLCSPLEYFFVSPAALTAYYLSFLGFLFVFPSARVAFLCKEKGYGWQVTAGLCALTAVLVAGLLYAVSSFA